MENNNKKVDIKALLEQNNLKVNDNQIEDKVENVLGNKPENFDPLSVENANEEMGQVMDENELLKRGGIRGGGVRYVEKNIQNLLLYIIILSLNIKK